MKKLHSPVYFEEDLFNAESFLKILKKHSGRFVLISDEKVASLYSESFLNFMQNHAYECFLVTFKGDEKSKTRKVKETIENNLLAKKLGKDTLFIIMGGGITTDIGGFVAATYMRGVPYLTIPTTLLGMVDAGIGGKTGINVKQAKNVIGAIYPPLAIFIDFSKLSTLPDSEMLCGSAEILKYALIADKRLFRELEKNIDQCKIRHQDFLKKMIVKSIKIKKKIIERDPQDTGLRKILNFGHTIGHAIETLEEYTLSHGEAIALGMIVEALISKKMGCLSKFEFDIIYEVIKEMGFSLKISDKVTIVSMKEVMTRDKKAKKNSPRFVILGGIGKVRRYKGEYCTVIKESLLDEALEWLSMECTQ